MTTDNQQEFFEALQRVSSREKKNLQWFLEFCRTPLVPHDIPTLERIWLDLHALAVVAASETPRQLRPTSIQEQIHWFDMTTLLLDPKENTYSAVYKVIQSLQETIDRHITTYMKHGFTLLNIPNLFFYIGKGKKPKLRNEFDFTPEGPVLYRLATVLSHLGNHLSTCENAHCETKRFLGLRIKQRFCSNRCGSRVRMVDWREKQTSKKAQLAKDRMKGGVKHGTKKRR